MAHKLRCPFAIPTPCPIWGLPLGVVGARTGQGGPPLTDPSPARGVQGLQLPACTALLRPSPGPTPFPATWTTSPSMQRAPPHAPRMGLAAQCLLGELVLHSPHPHANPRGGDPLRHHPPQIPAGSGGAEPAGAGGAVPGRRGAPMAPMAADELTIILAERLRRLLR